MKCLSLSGFWDILVSIKVFAGISKKLSIATVQANNPRNTGVCKQQLHYLLFLQNPWSSAHRCFCAFYFFLCSIREESLGVVLRAVHISDRKRSSSERMSGLVGFFLEVGLSEGWKHKLGALHAVSSCQKLGFNTSASSLMAMNNEWTEKEKLQWLYFPWVNVWCIHACGTRQITTSIMLLSSSTQHEKIKVQTKILNSLARKSYLEIHTAGSLEHMPGSLCSLQVPCLFLTLPIKA